MSEMNRALSLILVALSLWSCHKSGENIIWEKSFGPGKALFVEATGDTGVVSCGESSGKQYMLYLNEDKAKILEYKSDIPGLLNNVWTGPDYFIASGSSAGKMYLSKVDITGTLLWDSVFTTAFRVDHTSLCYLGDGSFLAIGSADPDSAITTPSGLSFIWFDSGGEVAAREDSVYTSYIAVKAAVTDNSGNLYLALTRMGGGGKPKASVAMYNSSIQRIWEKELYNNQALGAASLGIVLDDQANPVVTGRTELQVSSGKENNTFVARYFFSLDSLTKKYLEYSNMGTSILYDGTGEVMVLNKKCLIVNILDQDIKISGTIRTYNSCDSKTSDSFGFSMDILPDGNLVMAGSKGKSYYLVIKSSTALSPV
jgi:hypothetical protein